MRADKKKQLDARGWRVGTVTEFLGLSPEEKEFIELKLRLTDGLPRRCPGTRTRTRTRTNTRTNTRTRTNTNTTTNTNTNTSTRVSRTLAAPNATLSAISPIGYAFVMAQNLPAAYRIDPEDPRAPSQEAWDAMTPEERARVVAMLPAEIPWELHPPEGDQHGKATARTVDTLEAFFRRIGRKIYVSSELGIYYPGERRFVPDVLIVLDVDPHDRTKWVVADEGKGLDLVIEVHFQGDLAKDYKLNVERYARLGITEYFIFDRARLSLRGYRLPRAGSDQGGRARAYSPILPQQGRYTSEVLGLDLMVEDDKLRFLLGMAEVPEADELLAKLGSMLDQVLLHKQEAEERAQAEAARADAEAARAQAAEARAQAEAARAAELERELAEMKQKLAAAAIEAQPAGGKRER